MSGFFKNSLANSLLGPGILERGRKNVLAGTLLDANLENWKNYSGTNGSSMNQHAGSAIATPRAASASPQPSASNQQHKTPAQTPKSSPLNVAVPRLSEAEAGIQNALENAFINTQNAQRLMLARMDYSHAPWPLDRLSGGERELIKFPLIAKNEAKLATNPDMRRAWKILEDCFYLWFTNYATDNSAPSPWAYAIPWEWATGYDIAQDALNDLLDNLLNDTAKKVLENRLKDIAQSSKEVIRFDDTAYPPGQWRERSYQFRSVKHNPHPIRGIKTVLYEDSRARYYALGDFTIRALAKGAVHPLKDGGHEICVNNVYLFLDDAFNFDGDGKLGFWDFDNLEFAHAKIYKEYISNSDFQTFRQQTGYGRDFRIVSPLQKVEGIDKYCWRPKW